MNYVWTEEQRARVVPGCTLVFGGDRCVVTEVHRGGLMTVVMGPLGDAAIDTLDPASVRPPILKWLLRKAREKLGESADVFRVKRGRDDRDVIVVCETGGKDGNDVASFLDTAGGLDGASSCAVWLASLPAVPRG